MTRQFGQISLIAALLTLAGCNNGDSGGDRFSLGNFQAATLVIGQADFVQHSQNQGRGTVAAADTAATPRGAAFDNGRLYLADGGNNRVLGFLGLPTANDAAADFVLGQADFASTARGLDAAKMDTPASPHAATGTLVVPDSHNARVLIWSTAPTTTGVPANTVVGQPDFVTNATACSASGLQTDVEAVFVVNGKLIVADSSNNRVLIWNTIPTTNQAPANIVLGQNSFTTCANNDDDQNGSADAAPSARTLSHPMGIWSDGTRLAVADEANNRALIWNSFPVVSFAPADTVLGQGDFIHDQPNDNDQNGAPDARPSSKTLSAPTFLTSNGTRLFASDTGNNRVLVWNTFPTSNFLPAAVVLGQSDFTHNQPNDDNQDDAPGDISGRTLHQPLGLAIADQELVVSDSDNARWLIFNGQ